MKVVIAEPDAAYRSLVRRTLEREIDLVLVAEAAESEQAVRLAQQLKADVVLMDIDLLGVDGLEATRRITAELPRTKVIVLGALNGRSYRNLAVGFAAIISTVVRPSLRQKILIDSLDGEVRIPLRVRVA